VGGVDPFSQGVEEEEELELFEEGLLFPLKLAGLALFNIIASEGKALGEAYLAVERHPAPLSILE
jgi:hypothetical protein